MSGLSLRDKARHELRQAGTGCGSRGVIATGGPTKREKGPMNGANHGIPDFRTARLAARAVCPGPGLSLAGPGANPALAEACKFSDETQTNDEGPTLDVMRCFA